MSHSFPIPTGFSRRLSLGSSALALAAALVAAPAAAQSYQGSANVVFGSANVFQGGTTTDINIGSASAVIDWTPSDTAISNGTPINWQASGTTATYTGTNGNFAVLNRIVPADTSRPITFNGTTISQILTGQTTVRGGTVFFFSPGGIVVGPTGVFDVGNLGLTTAPPVVDANGGWYINNTVQFGQAATQSGVTINPGAQINATPQGSYVAAFAPYIQHDGTITANGRAALVAGEAGTITFSPDGLFDIQVTTGTGRTGIVHSTTGDITGSASTGAGDNRRIYMVAVPKNQLVTMSIQRGVSLGFDIAGAANVQGNAVVLTAGYNVTDGVAETARAGGGGTGTISINDSNANLVGTGIDFTSAVNANASADVSVDVFRQTRFASDAFLRGDVASQITVSTLANNSPGALSVGGNLTVAATRPGAAADLIDAGLAQLVLLNGTSANITGTARIESNASRDANGDGIVTAGTAQARIEQASSLTIGTDLIVIGQSISDGAAGTPDAQGSANVQLIARDGSTVNVARVTRVNSNGIAGLNNGNSGQGGDGRGGFSGLTVSGGSSFTTNELNIAADGVGGLDAGAGGGAATGGTALIQVTGANSVLTVLSPNLTGTFNFGELDFLSAESFGGRTALSGGTGGSAVGGIASMQASAGGRIELPIENGNNLIRFIGRARGGDVAAGVSGTGGAATGGTVSIALDNATLVAENLLASSFAQAGGAADPATSALVNGGSSVGGFRTISLVNGAVFTGSVTGGPGAQGGAGSSTGRGGDGTGGTATLLVDNSTLNVTANGVGVFSQNTSGEGAIFGDVSGGVAQADVINGATVNLATGARFGVTSDHHTFASAAIPVAQSGGNVTAGSAVLRIDNSSITGDGTVEVTASAFVQHNALTGGTATGGLARVEITNGTIDVNALEVTADAEGGDFDTTGIPVNGIAGGNASAGQASVILRGATLTADLVSINAEGDGGDVDEPGSTGLAGGDATGGFAILQAANGTNSVTAGDLRIDGSASAGTLFGGTGSGGDGTGGEARIDALAGASLTVTAPVEIVADGDGSSARDGGTGGLGTGGRAYSLANGGTITYNGGVVITAEAEGGDGDLGGAGRGGLAYLQSFTNGTTTVNGDAYIRADAQAGFHLGNPATGGAATGGTAQILATEGNARLSITGLADVTANAFGGVGARDSSGNGGPGGAATGGTAEIGGGGEIGIGNSITIAGTASVEASADAGYGIASSGGNATGGRALVNAGLGTSLTFGSDVIIDTNAFGGNVDDLNGVVAAAGTRGGDATGGQALIQTFDSGGAIAIGGDAFINSSAFGGEVNNPVGDGGTAVMGFAQVFARGGSVAIAGSLEGGADARGGSGDTGGDASAILTDQQFETGIVAANGTVTVGAQTTLFASATGGDGRNGGAGGDATAGFTVVDANSNANGASSITLADLFLTSSAEGGTGGEATAAAGGAGGNATGNAVQAFGTAGNGTLTVTGSTQLFSLALGGTGGASESGAGGAGGAATSGYIQFGTKSGADVGSVNAGSASFADIAAISEAVGGEGGASASATGGAGGDAIAAGGVLLVRGAPVTATNATVSGFGFGGNGGSGQAQGAGGFGAAGQVFLVASQRFQRTERGSANIGSLNLLGFGQGGAGSTPGASYYAGDGGVSLTQSDVTVDTLSYSNIGTSAPPLSVIDPLLPIQLVLSDATLDVENLSMSTPGDFLLDLANSTVNAGSFSIDAGTFVLPASPPAQPGTITVRDSLFLTTSGVDGSIRTYANFVILGDAFFSSSRDIALGDLETEGLIELAALAGTITVGDIDAGSAVLTAQGNIAAGDVQLSGQLLAQSSAGGVTLGVLDAGSANIEVAGSVTAGNIRVGSQLAIGSNNGSVTVGTVDAQDVLIEGTAGVSGQRLTASTIDVSSGATVSVLGAWTASRIDIAAGDLAIPDGGALAAGATGSVSLIATNAAGAFLGDGLAGQSGFRMSNSEFGRISGNSIFIGALDGQNPIDLTVGTLTLASSQLPGSEGSLEFGTGLDEESISGRIRVDGAFTGTGFSDSQYVSFFTGSFELNAETGSVSLAGNGPGGLGGIVEIEAANIHVASPEILTKLRDNPRYEGVADDLNRPASTQRPEGVLRALGLQFFPTDTLYIQNTGTANNPAGFYTTLEESDIEPPGFENSGAPDVDVIINGRFASSGGDIAGRDAFGAIIDNAESLDGFSQSSQVNGCAFSTEICSGGSEDSPELAVLQSEFELLSGQRIEEEPFDLVEGSDEEEEEAEQAARAPIEPPVVLIDTRPLNPPVDIVDPVSGSGNPAALVPAPGNSGPGDEQ